jgi:tetrahydromethanopterin S-methyltransferase subunit B
MRVKHAALVEALTGQFTEHHAYLARMLLDQIDGMTKQIEQLTATIETALTTTSPRTASPWKCSPGR